MSRRILALLVLILCVHTFGAQEQQDTIQAQSDSVQNKSTAPQTQPAPAPGQGVLTTMSEIERSTLALDIAVSNYYELRAMALEYGLPAGGGSAELRTSLYAFFGLKPPEAPVPPSSLVIESASQVEYFSLEEGEDRYMRLAGPIAITLRSEDGYSHSIKADEIIFDQEKNIVQARGNVEYIRQKDERSDEFFGSSLLVDLDSYSGVFLDGSYDLDPTAEIQRSLSLYFKQLSRRGSDLSLFEDARLTACDEADPHYHIKARKVWVFENGDWALANATLYLGVVPVLWLPFFYYPAEELFFHPVIGYRSREGAFVQTTTYFLGEEKRKKEESGLLSLISGTDNAGSLERSGLFIRRVSVENESDMGAPDGSAGKNPNILKLLVDIYSSLGSFLGLEGSFPGLGSGLDFSLGLGMSRSLFLQSSGFYSPFDYSNSYDSVWDSSNFLGLDLPFRFGAELKYAAGSSKGTFRYTFKTDLPLYSDPYFEQDFGQRKESSSVLSMIESNKTPVSRLSSMNQSVTTSLSWRLPEAGATAFLESVELSRFNSQMNWRTKSQSSVGLDAAAKRRLATSPSREFFYPDSLKILDAAISLSGSLGSFDHSARKKDEPHASDSPQEAEQAGGTESRNDEKIGRDFSNVSGRLGWTASGAANVEDKFRSSVWLNPEDVDASLSYRLLGWKGSGGLRYALSWAERLLSLEAGLGFNAQDQYRPILYDERVAPTTLHPYRLSDYAYRASVLDGSAALSLAPFGAGSRFSGSSLRYQAGATIFRNAYAGLSGSGLSAAPLYATTWVGWDSTTFSTHSLTAILAYAAQNKLTHSLSFQALLPPLLEKYTGIYSLSSKHLGASVQVSIARPTATSPIEYSNLSAQLRLGSSPYPQLKSSFVWDFESAQPLSSVSSLEYRGARASFTAKKAKGYYLDDGTWKLDGSEGFEPYEVSLNLNPQIDLRGLKQKNPKIPTEAAAVPAPAAAENSLVFDFKPSLSYTQNLIRFTESSIVADLGVSLTGQKGSSLRFSGRSVNKSPWRYWPGLFPASADFDPADYARDPFKDVLDAFSVWDTQALKRTLFKLQSLSLSLVQDLHDWNLEASLAMNPVLFTPDAGRPYYQLEFSFSFLVTWKDIPELKSSVVYDGGAFQR
ncbi:MAG: hypothetical protein RBT72_01655 [Spirochaetia bacterium]|nr:hypothetical protein [Spirochaetia bacterium]